MSEESTDVIDGYRSVNEIAAGSATVIEEVVEEASGTHFAMKMLRPEALENAEHKATLKREAKIGLGLKHPNIIETHKVKVTKQFGYIIMEYFRAPNLKQQLKSDLPGLQSRFRKLFDGLCQAFAHMHENGWIHKDIKPDNILFNRGGELRVIDFSLTVKKAGGLGKFLSLGGNVVQGTRTYIAPETIRKKPPTAATDIYSLGIVAFEVLTGRVPFAATTPGDMLRMHLQTPPPTPSAVNPNITPEMDRVIAKMLAKKPEKRYADMNELHAELRSVKAFKEDPAEMAAAIAKKTEEDRKANLASLSNRLDSRTDAERQALGIKSEAPKPKPKPKILDPTNKKKDNKQQNQPAAQGPPPQQMPPGYPQYPQYPQQMPPGYPQYPQQMPPGYGGQSYPQQGMPPQGMPPQPMPGQQPGPQPQNPQQQRPPQQQPPQQPAAEQKPPASEKKPEKKPQATEKADDLEEMSIDDLDIL
ncbi:serine/threonine protein kinase [Thalassoroseus pseudoceratinae]|uniref:serine/threonine protein kinase n=1 Tax=Thalassoroseus pseudoceratinae TaxID=2713176 RepID=UPI00142253BE|nr:serine/threonine-protein kinase [Thalassoroseus pseudoceratinae]